MKLYIRRRTLDKNEKQREFSIQASGGYAVFIVLCMGIAIITAINWLVKLL